MLLVEEGKPILEATENLAEAMILKHPERLQSNSPDPTPPSAPPLSVTKEIVETAIESFSWASVAGVDGLRPSHLKQITGPESADGKEVLLESLTKFTNLCLSGNVPIRVTFRFFGCRLLAFQKPDGGTRPTAIGGTLRRLVVKVACRVFSTDLTNILSPIQMEVGVRGGAEAAIHSARTFCFTMAQSEGFVKLDITNAFNSISRTAVIRSVIELAPALYQFVHCAYSTQSDLQFGGWTLKSREGVQQVDPLGPLLFS